MIPGERIPRKAIQVRWCVQNIYIKMHLSAAWQHSSSNVIILGVQRWPFILWIVGIFWLLGKVIMKPDMADDLL